MRVAPALQSSVVVFFLLSALCVNAQDAKPLQARGAPASVPASWTQCGGVPAKPNVAIVNGCPYQRPTGREQFRDYLRDSYLLPAQGANVVRAAYAQARDRPTQWGENVTGFMQRYGASAGITAINGNVRYGMENIFHEDLWYVPCHGCGVKRKIENALLAEITARHDDDGHRFFTLTPTIADYTGPIIAHSIYYPGGANPASGAVSARLVFATRIGQHLFREFVLERRHHDRPMER